MVLGALRRRGLNGPEMFVLTNMDWSAFLEGITLIP